jgi:hypothetical protein
LNLVGALKNLGEEMAKFGVVIGIVSVRRGRSHGGGVGLYRSARSAAPCERWLLRGRRWSCTGRQRCDLRWLLWRDGSDAAAESCRVEATERLVERSDIAELGMVGEECEDIAAVAENIFSESL